MINKNKPFDKTLHDDYDEFGRSKVKTYFLNKYGIILKDNSDIYGVDLIAYKDDKKIGYVEVEVRASWNKDIFPYNSLNIPIRKEKLLKNNLKTYLVSVNKLGTYAFICSDNAILSSSIEESKNKYVSSGEFFYKLNLKDIKLVKLYA